MKVTWPDGQVHEDEVRGLNSGHALFRARSNWEGAKVEPNGLGQLRTKQVAEPSKPTDMQTELAKTREQSRADRRHDVAQAANEFNKQKGLDAIVPGTTHNPELAKRIADAYDKMPHNPNDPAVEKSYDSLKKDIDDQWDYAKDKMGIKFEPWKKEGQPYANSKEMVADVKNNKHLYFFQGGELPEDHPLTEQAGEEP